MLAVAALTVPRGGATAMVGATLSAEVAVLLILALAFARQR
jgi:hypothetical protein